MIKIWFLMALMTYPNVNAIHYKGYGGFISMKECEDRRVLVENLIADYEIKRGNTVYIETFCLEMEAFKTQLEKKKEKQQGIKLEGQQLGV